MAAVTLLEIDASLKAMVIESVGKVFIGGADIREFGGPRLEPGLNAVCMHMDTCAKPIVVAIQGAALGGGFEVALAANVRVASPAADVGFPEVLLGLLPGAGGTQRAPRLCGAALALDLMLTGRRLTAAEALEAGLIDAIADNPVAAAIERARALVADMVAERGALPRARHGTALRGRDETVQAIANARAQIAARNDGLYSPGRIVDCVEVASTDEFDRGCAYEAHAFLDCLESPQRHELVAKFFAEREARKRTKG
jgi:3-hydroxyacyl-CoA dehydrogenase